MDLGVCCTSPCRDPSLILSFIRSTDGSVGGAWTRAAGAAEDETRMRETARSVVARTLCSCRCSPPRSSSLLTQQEHLLINQQRREPLSLESTHIQPLAGSSTLDVCRSLIEERDRHSRLCARFLVSSRTSERAPTSPHHVQGRCESSAAGPPGCWQYVPSPRLHCRDRSREYLGGTHQLERHRNLPY